MSVMLCLQKTFLQAYILIYLEKNNDQQKSEKAETYRYLQN